MQIQGIDVTVYRIPTDRPEADGTIDWDATTLVLVEATTAAGVQGLGYCYAAPAAAGVIRDTLAPCLVGYSVWAVGAAWEMMINRVRNLGRPGVAAAAISAVDIALWDLKAKALGCPLIQLLPAHRDRTPIYGSGGFTTYSADALTAQLGGWVDQGIPRVKMKIGKNWGAAPAEDVERVRIARAAIGPDAELFVDANGSTSRWQWRPVNMAMTRGTFARCCRRARSIFCRPTPPAVSALPAG